MLINAHKKIQGDRSYLVGLETNTIVIQRSKWHWSQV